MVCKTNSDKDNKVTCSNWAPESREWAEFRTQPSGERKFAFGLGELRGGEAIFSAKSANGSFFGNSSYCFVLQFSCLSSLSVYELICGKDGLTHLWILTPSPLQKCLLNEWIDKWINEWIKSQHTATFWWQMKDRERNSKRHLHHPTHPSHPPDSPHSTRPILSLAVTSINTKFK